MEFKKKHWKNFSFTKDKIPRIICPICNEGILELNKKSLFEEDTGELKEIKRKGDNNDPMQSESRYTVHFNCNNKKCEEVITSLGRGFFDVEYYSDNEGYPQPEYIFNYYPKMFYPPINIIPLKKNYPQNIKDELSISFALFFLDASSCANKIRISIELLLNNFRIRKTKNVGSSKMKRLNLHERIVLFKSVNANVSDLLLAVKWIGNKGSHYENVTINDILTAYEILDLSLTKLYDTREKDIIRVAKVINKTKGKKTS